MQSSHVPCVDGGKNFNRVRHCSLYVRQNCWYLSDRETTNTVTANPIKVCSIPMILSDPYQAVVTCFQFFQVVESGHIKISIVPAQSRDILPAPLMKKHTEIPWGEPPLRQRTHRLHEIAFHCPGRAEPVKKVTHTPSLKYSWGVQTQKIFYT